MDITLFLNELRVRALADALGKVTAETVEDKLTEAFDMLYQEYVPDEQRAKIEARIAGEEAAEQDRMEAARHFAVYHIRENGEDYHFTSDYFQTAMQAAYRYRRYTRGELSDEYKTFADAFVETQPISLEKFGEICTDMNSDKRVTALVEFDLETDVSVSVTVVTTPGGVTACMISPLRHSKRFARNTVLWIAVVKYSTAALQERKSFRRRKQQQKFTTRIRTKLRCCGCNGARMSPSVNHRVAPCVEL